MKLKTKFDDAVIAYTRWVIRWRWLVVIASLLLTVAGSSGGRFLQFSSDYRIYFSEDNPQLRAFEQLRNTYPKDDNILFVLAPRDGRVFTPNMLSAVEFLTTGAWQLPYSIRVDAVTNFQHSYAEGDNLVVEDLVTGAAELAPEAIARAKAVALKEVLLVNKAISPDGAVTGVNVTFQTPEVSEDEVPKAVAAARALAEQVRSQYPELSIYLTGNLMVNNAFAESAQHDLATLTPLMYVVVLIVVLMLLRSISGTIATLLIITVSTLTAMGLAGYMGISLDPQSASAPTLIMTLAIADSIHILLSMLYAMRQGLDKHAAIIDSIRLNFMPVLITSATTALGFLSLNFNDSPPLRDLGNITAIGVMVALIFSVTLLPAFMSIVPVKARGAQSRVGIPMRGLSEFVLRYRTALLVGMLVIGIGSLALIPLNEMNDQFVDYFDESIEFRNDTYFTLEHLTGVYPVQFSLDTGETNGIANPGYLKTVQDFAAWLREQEGVVHVGDLSLIMKRLNKNLHEDRDDWYRAARRSRNGGAIPASLRDVTAIRARSQQPNQR